MYYCGHTHRWLQGSNDTSHQRRCDWHKKAWTVLRAHRADTSMSSAATSGAGAGGGAGTCRLWSVSKRKRQRRQHFRFFRLVSTGPDSGGLRYLAFSCVELYGELVEDEA